MGSTAKYLSEQAALEMRCVSKTNARLKVVLICIPETAMLSIGEEEAALDAETAGRNFRDRVGSVGSFGRSLDRVAHVRIKATDVAVVAFGRRTFHLIPQPEIQGKP